MTTGMSIWSSFPASIPACTSASHASRQPYHRSRGERAGTRACSSRATRASMDRTLDMWLAALGPLQHFGPLQGCEKVEVFFGLALLSHLEVPLQNALARSEEHT